MIRDILVDAVVKTRLVHKNDAGEVLDAIIDCIEDTKIDISRAYWGSEWSDWGRGETDREPFEEGTVSAIIRGVTKVLRGEDLE